MTAGRKRQFVIQEEIRFLEPLRQWRKTPDSSHHLLDFAVDIAIAGAFYDADSRNRAVPEHENVDDRYAHTPGEQGCRQEVALAVDQSVHMAEIFISRRGRSDRLCRRGRGLRPRRRAGRDDLLYAGRRPRRGFGSRRGRGTGERIPREFGLR